MKLSRIDRHPDVPNPVLFRTGFLRDQDFPGSRFWDHARSIYEIPVPENFISPDPRENTVFHCKNGCVTNTL